MPSQVLTILNQPSADAPAHEPGASPFRFADVASPQLSMLDLGVTRGDGIFESISVGNGRAQAFDHHLSRFAQSAARLDLPTPDLEVWREAILATIDALDDAEESFVKAVLTRGIEGDGRPSGWAFGSHSPDFTRERTEGIRVVLLDRGYRHDIQHTSPWLLAGAKTISYAVNRAVVREAERRGAEDVIFVSSDGIVLEGPTSTLIFRRGNTLATPHVDLGILEGTTQANVFRFAEERGLSTSYEVVTPESLQSADAAWLVSSVRLAVPISALDDKPVGVDSELSAAMNSYLRNLRD
ncbi:MAG: aminodeoxychorismate lyase [Salinibacterium sp.]|nr:MAG: aminodeoxychorismate lyase [Salinibacterium sp.]